MKFTKVPVMDITAEGFHMEIERDHKSIPERHTELNAKRPYPRPTK
jgi:hypothetical protein